MTLTHNIYGGLREAFKNSPHQTLSRLYETSGGCALIFALEREMDRESLFFAASEKDIAAMPQCNGLLIEKVHLYEYSPNGWYCQITQNTVAENYIFETIIEDIRKNIDNLSDEKELSLTIKNLLLKWKDFFSKEKEIVMTAESQQGLYGELLFLKQLISIKGSRAVSFWTGYKRETHDFYIKDNAIEVKTTSTKAPYKMHISSEYQLDDAEVVGELYVAFYALRKGSVEGKTLPDLVAEIRTKLADDLGMRKKFDIGIEEYGYFDGLEEKYSSTYHVREEHTYCVNEGFPRIKRSFLATGVTGCTYDVSIDCCDRFEITREEQNRMLKGSDIIG